MAAYQAKLVSIIVGSTVITGFGENDMVKISRNSDSSTIKKGAKGETYRSLTHDKSGEFELTLSQESEANSILALFLNVDEVSGTGIPIIMVNNMTNGRTYIGTEEVSIKKFADETLGKELNENTWTIQCGNLDIQ